MIYDVVVIGAGPAGSVIAQILAGLNLKVLLVDKATFPRVKVCGCSLNGAAVGALERLGIGHVMEGGIPLDRVVIATARCSAALRLPGGLALSRETLDARLVQEAMRAGAEFLPATPAKLGRVFPDCREVLLAGTPGTARIVVLATGLIGAEAPPELGSRIGGAVMVSADLTPPCFMPGMLHMANGRGGYVGVVHVEGRRVNVAGAFDPGFVAARSGLGRAAEAILSEVGWKVPAGLARMHWLGTPALTRQPARVAGQRLFAIGDAAGYVEPFTGEGMAWAILTAVALTPLVARAAKRWDPALTDAWEATYRRVVRPRQRLCRLVAKVLRSPVLTNLAVGALRLFPVLSSPVIRALNTPHSHPERSRA
jgi:flavin-dependent dehydrogenase